MAKTSLIPSAVYHYCDLLCMCNLIPIAASKRGWVRIFLSGESIMSLIQFWQCVTHYIYRKNYFGKKVKSSRPTGYLPSIMQALYYKNTKAKYIKSMIFSFFTKIPKNVCATSLLSAKSD